ncbi:MAG: MarR family winged helix-turn-helix transcriptional regulator [Planctomycetota bacterium]|jgi:DNA-binding MarR family transcriptional regulator
MATGHDIAMGLRAAYWSMHRQTNACLARHGATAEQFVLLALLAEQDRITQQELGRRASSDPNTIRLILVLLEDRGLLVREQHPTDRRARCVTLTRKGQRAYRKLSSELKPLQERLLGTLPSADAHTLVAFLARISDAMAPPKDRQARPERPLKGERP